MLHSSLCGRKQGLLTIHEEDLTVELIVSVEPTAGHDGIQIGAIPGMAAVHAVGIRVDGGEDGGYAALTGLVGTPRTGDRFTGDSGEGIAADGAG
jgi:hypothetical protein